MPLVQTRGAASAQGFGEFAQATAANYIEDVFSTYLYTGNSSSSNPITNGVDLAGKGGLVWIKSRNDGDFAASHVFTDTVRGGNKVILSNSTAAEVTTTAGTNITSFNSNGFTLGNTFSWYTNYVFSNLASWTFRKQPKFFDVVTYTGNGAAARAISHNLGSTPGCMIVKRTDAAGDWRVYHRGCSTDNGLVLNDTAAQTTSAIYWFGNEVNVIPPTSTQFTVNAGFTNTNGGTYVAYLFAHDAGGFGLTGTDNVISCGSFTTDGSGDATVSLGYEPQWVMLKASSTGGNWEIDDTFRGMPVTGNIRDLLPNSSAAESVGGALRPSATGFYTSGALGGSSTYIYIAIRRGPMKVPTLGTSVFKPMTTTGDGNSVRSFTGVGFPPDLVFPIMRASPGNHYLGDRLRGSPILETTSTVAENSGYVKSYDQDGWTTQSDAFGNNFNFAFIDYLFRRAPGFFDEVCYTGTGSGSNAQTHNLGVVPELIITKIRSGGTESGVGGWGVYAASLGSTKVLELDSTAASATDNWFNATPTATTFYVFGNDPHSNRANGNYVAYLFATCAGVSKVGSYTGTGTTQTINCSFTGGARFVLIKRTDSTGDWYVWDSARGIVAGNDPYLLLNSTAAEVTSTDYVDTASTGFEISSTAPAAINANGGSFIFLAIA